MTAKKYAAASLKRHTEYMTEGEMSKPAALSVAAGHMSEIKLIYQNIRSNLLTV